MRILTNRTYIVPYEKAHIPDVLDMLLEPDTNRFISPLHGKNREQLKDRLNKNLLKNRVKLQYFSVFDKYDNQFVGTMNLNDFEDTGLQQLGLHLKKSYWNKGLGFELSKELLIYAFCEMKIEKIHWVFEKGHLVSQKLAEKLGFEPYLEMEEDNCLLKIYKLENKFIQSKTYDTQRNKKESL